MNVWVHLVLKMYVKCSYIKKLANKQHQCDVVHNSIKPIPKEIQSCFAARNHECLDAFKWDTLSMVLLSNSTHLAWETAFITTEISWESERGIKKDKGLGSRFVWGCDVHFGTEEQAQHCRWVDNGYEPATVACSALDSCFKITDPEESCELNI